MTNSFVVVAQINVKVGSFDENAQKIIRKIEQAKEQGSKLIIFPELVVCGYPPRDFLEFNSFIGQCEKTVLEIARFAQGIAVVVGAPSKNTSGSGKKLYNSAYLLQDGDIKDVFHKSLLPTYDVFDEYRYFEPNHDFRCFEIDGHVYGVAICEDLWNEEDEAMYKVRPGAELKKLGVQTVLNIAASPFSYRQHNIRKKVLQKVAKKYSMNIAYCNHVGAQTELIFDGGSMLIDATGEVTSEAVLFKEQLLGIESLPGDSKIGEIALIHQALVLGIKDYFRKLGFQKAVVGLSGGIDSAVTFALAAEALGAENVHGVLMPSQYSSDHSVADAYELANNLGAKSDCIEIAPAFHEFESGLEPLFKGLPFGLAEENLQARIRGVYLMAISNKFGNILLNTSNKSEAAVGYGTLYGDMNGGVSVLGDLYKTQVFDLAKYINKEQEIIPVNTIVKPPSAELRPDQKDSDSLPDYDVLDEVLHLYIEERKGEAEIIDLGYDADLVKRILKLVNLNEYKRYQTPPTFRVSPKAFGMGRRMPIVAKY